MGRAQTDLAGSERDLVEQGADTLAVRAARTAPRSAVGNRGDRDRLRNRSRDRPSPPGPAGASGCPDRGARRIVDLAADATRASGTGPADATGATAPSAGVRATCAEGRAQDLVAGGQVDVDRDHLELIGGRQVAAEPGGRQDARLPALRRRRVAPLGGGRVPLSTPGDLDDRLEAGRATSARVLAQQTQQLTVVTPERCEGAWAPVAGDRGGSSTPAGRAARRPR